MCGIAGLWTRTNGSWTDRAVTAMTNVMYHRGPDDGGLQTIQASDGLLVLGARRLAIQDLSEAGHQPMHDPQTGNWIVFNGEIYNFRTLRTEMERVGVRFRSGGDTEVLLRAYGLWGTDSIRRLRGMYAFALWDAASKRLILARDRLGVKPIYYAEMAGTLLFASEVRALLASRLVSGRLCLEGLAGYLALGSVQDPHTLFEGVRALPAGHYAIWKDGNVELHEYWSLRQSFRADRDSELDGGELAARLRAVLATAIELRLISDAPIGTFLSGGTDSSTITALAAQLSSRPIRTVSVVFPEQQYSEKRYIDLVSHQYGTDHTEVSLTHQEFADMLPGAIGAMDEPTFDGVNTYVVSRAAHMAGLTVALSGIGGDELFGGYRSFDRVPRLRMIRRWMPPVMRGLTAMVVRKTGRESDPARKLSRWIQAGGDLDGGAELLSRELFGPSDRQRLVPEIKPVVPAPAEHLGDPELEDFNSVSFFELSHYMKNVLLRDTDVMSMAHSLEVREPFLDHHLVELVASLPGRIKQRSGMSKALLTHAVRNDLPAEILQRPKMGFTFPFTEWLRGSLRSPVEQILLDPKIGKQVAEVLDPETVKSVWRRFLSGSSRWVRPWSLYVLKQWAESWL